jgi:uncharacterized membrane protein/membrane-bound inhibitor of C-type lysozyme
MSHRLYLLFFCTVTLACGGRGLIAMEADFRPDPRPLASTMVYNCNGYEFIARLGPGEMALWLPDRYVILSQIRSTAGVRYQESAIVFLLEDSETTLTLGGVQFRDCKLMPERAPWADARRRHVDFRAVGHDPGWSLEIQRDRQLHLVGDDDSLRVITPDPGEQLVEQGRVYHTVTERNDLRVEIVEESCTDSITGETLASRVVVAIDGITLYGCGRNLDYPW